MDTTEYNGALSRQVAHLSTDVTSLIQFSYDEVDTNDTPSVTCHESAKVETEIEEPTTLMLKNIPSRFDQEGLIVALEPFGAHAGIHYDFFYLPCNPRTNKNLGYAFINFLSKSLLEDFSIRLSRVKLLDTSEKLLEVLPARVQGLYANCQLFAESASEDSLKSRPLAKCGTTGLMLPLSVPDNGPVSGDNAFADPEVAEDDDKVSDNPVNPFFRMNTAWSVLAEY